MNGLNPSPTSHIEITANLDRLLPDSFGPAELGLTSTLLDSEVLKMSSLAHTSLEKQAVVALQISSGEIFMGMNIENAAFNPGLSPFQIALINLVSKGHAYNEISKAVLTEELKIDSAGQGSGMRILLKAISPLAKFKIIPIHRL